MREKKYWAKLTGHQWAGPVEREVATITEARQWAEEYGSTADECYIYDKNNKLVARHRRDPNGDGGRWYKATP